jgi:hypothetical protein
MSSDPDGQKDLEDSLKIEVGAVVKAEAAAKYERKTEISIEVPEDVTRAKAQALLDAISPITNSLGLIGDWLASARENLKAHRLRTLTTIADKVNHQIQDHGKAAGEIPIKALLPMLEKASLEAADDEALTTTWASLIATSSVDYDPEVIAFTRILSEISARECKIINMVFSNRWDWVNGARVQAATRRLYEEEDSIKPLVRDAVIVGDRKIFSKLRAYVDSSMPMQFTYALTRGVSQKANWTDRVIKDIFYEDNEIGYKILESQGVISYHSVNYSWKPGETPVDLAGLS